MGVLPDVGIFVSKQEEEGRFLDFVDFLEFFFDKNLQKGILWDGQKQVGSSSTRVSSSIGRASRLQRGG